MSKKKRGRQQARAEPTQRRSAAWLCSSEAFDTLTCRGYTSLAHNPEIAAGVDTIARLCELGWGNKLLLSHDLAAYLAFWDSWETTKNSDYLHLEEDFTFIHRRVLPALRERGLEPAVVDGLLTANPRTFFEGTSSH